MSELRRVGDAPFYGYRTACPECDGTGVCRDVWRWLHACRALVWFTLIGVLLSRAGASVIAMIAVLWVSDGGPDAGCSAPGGDKGRAVPRAATG